MPTFLSQFKQPGSSGMGQGVWDRAIAAGYSPKQIAVASQKEGAAGNEIGEAFKINRAAAAAATKGSSNNWIHNYTGGSGGVGIGGLNQALAAGYTPEQLKAAASGLHMKQDWGVPGFGQGASQYLNQAQMVEEMMDQIPQMPEIPEIEFPGTQTGARNVSNYNATGLVSPRPEGWDLNTGGTKAAFGRKKNKLKNIVNALSINSLTP